MLDGVVALDGGYFLDVFEWGVVSVASWWGGEQDFGAWVVFLQSGAECVHVGKHGFGIEGGSEGVVGSQGYDYEVGLQAVDELYPVLVNKRAVCSSVLANGVVDEAWETCLGCNGCGLVGDVLRYHGLAAPCFFQYAACLYGEGVSANVAVAYMDNAQVFARVQFLENGREDVGIGDDRLAGLVKAAGEDAVLPGIAAKAYCQGCN